MEPPYAAGVHSASREYTDTKLTMEGSIPTWLSGTLLRNGPGQFQIGETQVTHWFDGLAYLRQYSVANGEITFSSRFLQSKEYESVQRHNVLYRDQFGTNTGRSNLRRLYTTLRGGVTDNCVVNIDRCGKTGAVVALTETTNAVMVDPQSLETQREITRFPDIDITGAIAHVQYDFDRHTVLTLGYRFGRHSAYVLIETEYDTQNSRVVTTIPVHQPAYIHSFTITPTHIIVTEPPFRFSPTRALCGHPFKDCFTFDETASTRFFVIDREQKALVATVETASMFVFHHVNAYNQNKMEIVVDLIAYENPEIIDRLTLRNLRTGESKIPAGQLIRYRLNLESETVDRTLLHADPIEFPTIAYRSYNGQPYRYLYAAGNTENPPHGIQNRIQKIDTNTGAVTQWSATGTFVGEPLVVEHPEGAAEEDCILLVPIMDVDAEQSGLVVLSGTDLSELGRGMLPTTIPFGFHGQFYTDENTQQRSMA